MIAITSYHLRSDKTTKKCTQKCTLIKIGKIVELQLNITYNNQVRSL
jgi:hypothetical protein